MWSLSAFFAHLGLRCEGLRHAKAKGQLDALCGSEEGDIKATSRVFCTDAREAEKESLR